MSSIITWVIAIGGSLRINCDLSIALQNVGNLNNELYPILQNPKIFC